MRRTWGGPTPRLRLERAPLLHAEAVLLVHHEAEAGVRDALGEEGVRPHDHVGAPVGERLQDAARLRAGERAGEELDRDPERPEEVVERDRVLAGQEIGRGKQGALDARPCRQRQRVCPDRGLARSDVARWRGRDRDRGRDGPLATPPNHPDLKREQLVEGEPSERGVAPLEVVREVHLGQRILDPDQSQAAADRSGQVFRVRRLAFDELLALQVGMVGRRRERAVAASVSIATTPARDAEIRGVLAAALGRRLGREVDLTGDQERAMDAVRDDVRGPHPMLRLLQGDVGSGKTAVGAYALALAAGAGVQGALLAPTDLLARQHAVTLDDLLRPLGIAVELLTGSLAGRESRRVLEALADGRAHVVVGTHALFSERVAYARLGLVVVDEQHRFGVAQRGALEAKTRGGAAHVLLMTATPIPRTIGQVLYADLDVTDLR